MPRILLVKTSSMGDVIHNFPIIADIRKHHPHATFDWVVEEGFAEIARLHPHVRDVIPVAIRRWRKHLLQGKTWAEIADFRKRLTSKRYDHVLDTQGLIKSAVISRMANGPSYGQDRQSAREPLAACLYEHRYYSARNQHAVARNRELAALALGYPVPTTLPDYGLAGSSPLVNDPQLALPEHYIVGLHATSRDSKLWAVEHWITLGRGLNEQGYALLLPWASESEHARAASIAQNTTGAIVLPKLRLTQLAGIIAGARAAVGVDTGLAHLAVALKCPTVAIYTDTDPSLTGIYPGSDTFAVNLGGKAMPPSPQHVIQSLAPIIAA